MSSKRMLGISIFSVLFIAALLVVMQISSIFPRANRVIQLPQSTESTVVGEIIGADALDRIEITRETVVAVISQTLKRPDTYSRVIVVNSFWDGGQANYIINVNVANDMTSMTILPLFNNSADIPADFEKRVITTNDYCYIWHSSDNSPFVQPISSISGIDYRSTDEWQMLVTYDDMYALDEETITGAGYTEYGGDDCIYVDYITPILGYTGRYYISIKIGLVVGAEEYDETGALVYSMTAGECLVGSIDHTAFLLPDGTDLQR